MKKSYHCKTCNQWHSQDREEFIKDRLVTFEVHFVFSFFLQKKNFSSLKFQPIVKESAGKWVQREVTSSMIRDFLAEISINDNLCWIVLKSLRSGHQRVLQSTWDFTRSYYWDEVRVTISYNLLLIIFTSITQINPKKASKIRLKIVGRLFTIALTKNLPLLAWWNPTFKLW